MYYFEQKIRNKTPLSFKNYLNPQKKLPKGWILQNLDGKLVYKYIRDKKVLNSSYDYDYAYSPRELREFEIFQMSYEDLDEEEEKQKAEACRRYNLFKKVARLLNLRTDSICDESLDFFAKKVNILPQIIIDFIELTELKQLGRKAFLTLFSTIRRNDPYFSSERSMRELCGVNTGELEAEKAMNEIQYLFTCPVSRYMFMDPVICSSGHTFEREDITRVIRTKKNPVCPITRVLLTGKLIPNHDFKQVIEHFVEKYQNQKGDHWTAIVDNFRKYTEYTKFSERLEIPIDVEIGADYKEPIEEEEVPPEYQSGRTSEELRNYLIDDRGYDLETIDNIPEFVANSGDSSYYNLMKELYKREEEPDYLEKHRSRTDEELIAYIRDNFEPIDEEREAVLLDDIRPHNSYAKIDQILYERPRNPEEIVTGRTADQLRTFLIMTGYDDDELEIDNIPEFVADSEDSSYDNAFEELFRRDVDGDYREEHRSRTDEELIAYIRDNFEYLDEEDKATLLHDIRPHNSYAKIAEIGRRRYRNPEEIATGRTAEQLRNYLINDRGLDPDSIDNIPEFVADSENSSYDNAFEEFARRGRDDDYREEHRSRTDEELIAYIRDNFEHVDEETEAALLDEVRPHNSYNTIAGIIFVRPRNHTPEYIATGRTADQLRTFMIMTGYVLETIDNIPEFVADSEDSSYGNAFEELARRGRDDDYREEHRSRTDEELIAYIRDNFEYVDEEDKSTLLDAVSPHNSYARIYAFMMNDSGLM